MKVGDLVTLHPELIQLDPRIDVARVGLIVEKIDMEYTFNPLGFSGNSFMVLWAGEQTPEEEYEDGLALASKGAE